MGDSRGFLKLARSDTPHREVCQRIQDFKEVAQLRPDKLAQEQASRCMDCGTPFCHWGCPVGNYIPEWNDLIFKGQWQKAGELLQATNNFPEITGRICPAICEHACVLSLNDEPVTIRDNELSIIEHAFKQGMITPCLPKIRTGKRVAVVGSGPSGLACADQLNKAGHRVVVFEKDAKVGGILRYGIPDFKLEKEIIDRRVSIMHEEGIDFMTNVNVGAEYSTARLLKEFDAIVLAGGCRMPRDLNIPGRDLNGIYFAMDYLVQANKRLSGEKISEAGLIDAKAKKVVVIGGGDTGADCVGVAHRQLAKCVIQIELMPKPGACRSADFPWPKYPLILKTTTSHEEGGERHWSILTKKFSGDKGRVKKLSCVKLDFSQKDEKSCPVMKEIPGTEFEIDADLVILALGFIHPEKNGLLEELNIALDARGNIKTDANYMTSVKKVFSAGDARRGQSLIVWAISEGRRAAYNIDKYLMGESTLPLI